MKYVLASRFSVWENLVTYYSCSVPNSTPPLQSQIMVFWSPAEFSIINYQIIGVQMQVQPGKD